MTLRGGSLLRVVGGEMTKKRANSKLKYYKPTGDSDLMFQELVRIVGVLAELVEENLDDDVRSDNVTYQLFRNTEKCLQSLRTDCRRKTEGPFISLL